MSIKNPLPGHQYGRSEPGYWYPRPDPPPRSWDPRRLRAVVAWLSVVLVVVVAADVARTNHGKIAVHGVGYVSPPAAAPLITAPPTTAAPVPAGYPGAQVGDRPADGSGAVTVGGMAVAASGWVATTPGREQRSLCLTASIMNRSASEVAYGLTDWALQSPTGDVHAPVLYDVGRSSGQPPALTSGQLIPAGTTAGRVCFSDPGASGTYVVSFRPETPVGGRGIWLVRMP